MQNNDNFEDIEQAIFVPGNTLANTLKKFETEMLNRIKDKASLKNAYDASGSIIDKNVDGEPLMKSHVMVNNMEPEMGTHWAIATVYDDSSVTSGSSVISSLNIPIGKLDGLDVSKNIVLDPQSATYYAANINFTYSDTMEGVANSTDGTVRITFDVCQNDLTHKYYNSFKAVNSSICRSNAAEDDENGIIYSECDVFNENHSLLSRFKIVRDASSGQLDASGSAYQETDYLNIEVQEATNGDVLFGMLKLYQPAPGIDVSYSAVSNMSLVDSSNNSTFNNLPTSLNVDGFNALFDSDTLPQVGPGYEMTIDGYREDTGGYTLSFRGFDLNDESIVRNVKYMSTLSDFSDVSHNVVISNGTFTSAPNDMFELIDGDEMLDSNYYDANGSFQTYLKSSTSRVAVNVDISSVNLPAMRITYAGDSGANADVGTVSEAILTTYDVNYDVEVVVPATIGGSTYLSSGPKVVGRSPAVSTGSADTLSAAAVITDSSVNNLGRQSNITFTSDNLGSLSGLNLFHIEQKYEFDQEAGALLYSVDGGVNVVYEDVLTSVAISNAKLASVDASDLKLKIMPKIINDITQWDSATTWLYSGENDEALQSQKITQNDLISSDDVLNIMNLEDGFTYEVALDYVTRSTSVEGLDIALFERIYYGASESPKCELKRLHDFEIVSKSTYTSLPVTWTTSISGITPNLVLTKTRECVKFRTNLGPYNNLVCQTKDMYTLTGELYLTDSTGARLPDSKLRSFSNNGLGQDVTITVNNVDYTFNFKGNKSFRVVSWSDIVPGQELVDLISANVYEASSMELSESLAMSSADLFGFLGQILKKNSDNSWSALNSVGENVDLVLNIPTAFVTNLAHVSVDIDIPTDNVIPLSVDSAVPATVYYIELSNKAGTTTYEVSGKSYSIENVTNFSDSWSPYSDDVADFYPVLGTPLSLIAQVFKADSSPSNPADQNEITLKIFNSNEDLLFTFVCSENLAVNMNVIYNPAPIVKVVETIGEEQTTYYTSLMSQKTLEYNYVLLTNSSGQPTGIEVKVMSSANVGDRTQFQLLGDEIACKPYPGYTGSYSTRTEITPDLGELPLIGDNSCRKVELSQYRGVVADAVIELVRTATTIEIQITKNSVQYTQSLGSLYDGSSHLVDNLSTLGNLGLILSGHYSMFSDVTNMTQEISVSHGKYYVTVSNPLDEFIEYSDVIYTNAYGIKPFETLQIKASRVKIYADEHYEISNGIPNLLVTYISDASANPIGVNVPTYNFNSIDAVTYEYTDGELRNGDGVTIAGNSQLRILRDSTNVQSFTEYYTLPRPQFKVAAISTVDVENIPYDARPSYGPDRRVAYCDVNTLANSYNPFFGDAYKYGMNNITVEQIMLDVYTNKRLNPSSSIKTFNILDNTVFIKMSNGDINSNTPNVGDNYYNDFVIYNGQLNLIENSNNPEKVMSSYDSSTGLAAFFYRQPMRQLVSSDIADALTNLNIIVNDITVFGVGQGKLLLATSGSNTRKFRLYGSRIDRDTASGDNALKYVFVKYETDFSTDYTSGILSEYQVLKNIKFFARTKWETSVTIERNNTLTETPYNLHTALLNSVLAENFNWESVPFTERFLNLSLVSVSTVGLGIVEDWLDIDNNTRYKVLLLETPDMFAVRSLDGALCMKISYSGCVIAPSVTAYESAFSPSVPPFTSTSGDDDNSENITDEFFAYNITSIAGN